jgi:hypothetical protein
MQEREGEGMTTTAMLMLIFACSRSGDKWPVSLVAVIMLKCLACMHAEDQEKGEQRNGTSEGMNE